MKAFLLQKIPLDFRTAAYCFCAAGCIYPFCDYLLYRLGWSGFDGWQATRFTGWIFLAQWGGMPIVSLLLARRSLWLAGLGLAFFLGIIAAVLAIMFCHPSSL